MKKVFTLIMCMAALAAFNAQAGHVTVGSKADFEAEFFKERANDVIDTIFVRATPSIIALTNAKVLPNRGTIHVIGVDDEENGRAKLGLQWNLPTNTEADRLSVFLENLVIECNGGNTANSKYLFNMKDTFYHYMDTLVFSNCEVKNYNRALFRCQPEARSNGLKDGGEINYFGVEGCTFHTGYYLNNPMSLFRMDMRVSEMVFRNNLFYDLGYVHSIVQFSTMTEEAGRVDINFTFENNTFIGHCSQGALMNFDSYVGQMSEFHINNNIFLVPNWVDDYNNPGLQEIMETNPDTLNNLPRPYLASVQFGMMECKNNVVAGYRDPRALLDNDNEGDFLSADIDNLTMDTIGFGWEKFTDAQEGLFYIWKGEPIFTAGIDGAPIGDVNLYTDTKQVTVTVNISIEGSKTADFILNDKVYKETTAKFISGDEITVTAVPKGNLNKFLGWSNGSTELSQVITLEDNLDLVARFEEGPYRAAWNFEQLEKNNVKLNAPLEANFYKGGTPYTLCYATWDGTQYVDSTTEALMTRNNKVAGDVRNCVFVHTDSAKFADKTPSDFIYFEVPSVEEGSYLTFNIASDNMCYKTTLVDYSTDKATWTNIVKAEISKEQTWFPVKAEIPAALAGQKIYLRIKGDETSEYFMGEDFAAQLAAGTQSQKTEFLFVSEIYYFGPTVLDGIMTVKATRIEDATVYDILGRRVLDTDNLKPGIYLQGGKKFIVR
ncbi:MAG: hypothetical protein ILP04_08105 [Bacteroidales bacterium]|nr:hypothetical protein [Bacteroidales bacterium]